MVWEFQIGSTLDSGKIRRTTSIKQNVFAIKKNPFQVYFSRAAVNSSQSACNLFFFFSAIYIRKLSVKKKKLNFLGLVNSEF